ncbi:ABCC1 [Bugula neritina]|uniref:ABCC1 n=1 Tax=Bugula neritina TaxID=10212 RepID=A0A7J7JX72_BUGNE|nr:ABCC1 [Bugula neritina]
MKGYKNSLQQSDLFELKDIDRADAWVPHFSRCWTEETERSAGILLNISPAYRPAKGQANRPTADVLNIPLEEVTDTKSNNSHLHNSCSAAAQERQTLLSKLPEGKRPSLMKCLAKVFLPSMMICALLKLVQDLAIFINPIILRLILKFVKDSSQPSWRGYVYGCLMFLVSLLQLASLGHYFQHANTIGMRLRATICASVYNKALKLSPTARKESTVGEIVNLMSVDAQRFMDIMTYLNIIWSGPFQIIVALVFLWRILGPSVLVGMSFMGILVPLNAFIGKQLKKLQVEQMKEKDKRIKLMSEVLNGIKVLKLYAWEQSYSDIISGIRQKELVMLRRMGFLNAATTLIFQIAPFFVACSTFLVYTLVDESHVLDAEKAFVSLALFNIMRFPMIMLPNVINSLIQTSVSVKRITKFLSLPELDLKQIEQSGDNINVISIKDCTFTWNDFGDENPALKDISVDVKKGELVAVVGVVGAGKSSLLSALLGDMTKLSGQASVNGTVAYVPQQAWIQNATLRDNILFGAEYEQSWYSKVVEACALLPDFSMLPAGDLTEIGEKGINLSGGQKQRVSLARAVYSRADIYYLDDPLSAVDAHVGKHIFDHVIGSSGCLKGKTRVLVTHGISYLLHVDSILVMKDGELSERGSFQQLIDHAGAFSGFLKTYFLKGDDQKISDEGLLEECQELEANADLLSHMSEVIDDDFKAIVRDRLTSVSSLRSKTKQDVDTHSLRSARSLLSVHNIQPSVSLEVIGEARELSAIHSSSLNVAEEIEKEAVGNNPTEKLIQAEGAQHGRVSFAVVKRYITAMGWLPALLTIIFFVMDQSCGLTSNIWLSRWSDDVRAFNNTDTRNKYLGLYTGFGVAQGFFTAVASIAMAMVGVAASFELHKHLLENILKNPMSFFETTPLGRIINRFSSDIADIDLVIPFTCRSLVNCVILLVLTIAIVGYTTPWCLLPAVLLAAIYVIIQAYWRWWR